MVHRRLLVVMLIAQICIAPALCEDPKNGYYTIVAPGSIKPHRKYSVAVSLHDASDEATIRLELGDKSSPMLMNQEVTLKPHETKLIDFQPDRLENATTYELRAEGLKGLTFKDSADLNVLGRGGPRIFIQSDKAKYKQKDVVQYNVIILDEHMRPKVIQEPIMVEILDVSQQLVWQDKHIQLKQGVYTGRFELSSDPLLGKWTIRVTIGGKYDMKKEKKFEVSRYVLPKFKLDMEVDHEFLVEKRYLSVEFAGRYAFDAFVKGKVDATLFPYFGAAGIRKTATIEDDARSATMEFDIESIPEVKTMDRLMLEAKLTEFQTGESHYAFQVITLIHQNYTITVPAKDIEYVDNQPHHLKVHIRPWDNSPLDPSDLETPVVLAAGSKSYETKLNEDGIAEFTLDNESSNDLLISFKDSTEKIDLKAKIDIGENEVAEGNNCRLQATETNHGDYTEIDVEVTADHVIPYVEYTITGHGNIVRNELVKVPHDTKSHTFKIRPTSEMIPTAFVYVFYVQEGHLCYCETTIQQEEFVNKVELSSHTRIRPGDPITLNIKAEPNSHVSILAVDRAIQFLSVANLLDKEQIMDELRNDLARAKTFYPGSESGLITMTNANVETAIKFGERYGQPDNYPNYGPGYLRTKFPETWIFKDLTTTANHTTLTLNAPDTITVWYVSAFSINDMSGFGMTSRNLEIIAQTPFFITASLPFAVKRGEIVRMPVTIFNHLAEDLDINVAVALPYTGVQVVNNEKKLPISAGEASAYVKVPAGDTTTVTFWFSALSVGEFEIRITAVGDEVSDDILQKLRVESDGIRREVTEEMFVTLGDTKSFKNTFTAVIPSNVITNSEYMTFSVAGDFLVPIWDHLNNLIERPTGNGEDNMAKLAPNILALDYLAAVSDFVNRTEIEKQALRNAKEGFQNELKYFLPKEGAFRRQLRPNTDGSKPNMWLTAFAVRFFIKGKLYTTPNHEVINNGLKYLSRKQLDDGSFPYEGTVYNPPHQNDYALTAYVLLTFLENEDYAAKYDEVVKKGVDYLVLHLGKLKTHDVYGLAIAANVLALRKDSHFKDAISILNQMAHEENGLRWWSKLNKKVVSANDVEITGYALMALLHTSGDFMPIVNWLLAQRNPRGGFKSTHDTVVALEALVKYMQKVQPDKESLQVEYAAKDASNTKLNEGHFQVDSENLMVLQMNELSNSMRTLDTVVTGYGSIYMQFFYRYYVPEDWIEHKYFPMQINVAISSDRLMSATICFSYEPETDDILEINSAVMTANFPSGYVANRANEETLAEENPKVVRALSLNDGYAMEIYFEKLVAHEKICISIAVDKYFEVSELKPANIEIADNVEPLHRTIATYDLEK